MVNENDFPQGVIADSGNGYHLLFPIDLAAEDEGLVERFLKHLAAVFDDDYVKVDTVVHDAIRRVKVYGTKVCKGEDTPERPHRYSEIMYEPREIMRANKEVVENLIGVLAVRAGPQQGTGRRQGGIEAGEDGRVRRRYFPLSLTRAMMKERSRNYVAKMPVAVQGKQGHDSLFAVACLLVRDAALTIEEARPLIQEYSERCSPPWRLEEYHQLEHKLQDADDFAGLRGKLFVEWGNFTSIIKKNGKPGARCHSAPIIHHNLVGITDGWPRRVAESLFVLNSDGQVYRIKNTSGLFAWVSGQLPARNSNPIRWESKDPGAVGREIFFNYLQQKVQNYDSVETYPHFPRVENAYYACQQQKGGDGHWLNRLLDRFSPATTLDRELILAAFMTVLWGGKGGQRPAFLITTDEEENRDKEKGRGSGKTTLAETVANLVGGCITIRPTYDIEAIMKRLLSPQAADLRVALVDNIKTSRFSWDDLENLITTDTFSGHRMYQGEGRLANRLTWFLTLNGASLSKDMAQRVVTIKVSTNRSFSATWSEETSKLITDHRWEIFGDLQALFNLPAVTLAKYTRWGRWEQDVLSKVGNPNDCQALIQDRQAWVDDDQEESDMVRDYFREKLNLHGHCPETSVVRILSETTTAWLNAAVGGHRPGPLASRHLKGLSIPELQKDDKKSGRGWTWRGAKAAPDKRPEDLKSRGR